ncbi:MMPL family transporter [Kineosporia succinea]
MLAVLLFVALAGVVGGPVAGAMQTEGGFAPGDAESVRAVERIEAATGRAASAGVLLIVEPAAVDRAVSTLSGIGGVTDVAAAGSASDGSSVLVTGTLLASASEDEVGHDVFEAFDGNDAVTAGGSAVMGLQLGEQTEQDLTRAELLAFPALVLLSILIFGGRGAVLPLVVGVTTVMGTFAVLTGVNQLYGLSIFALNLVIGLGLGLAVDYSLFLLNRYREELAAGVTGADAVLTTLRTAGRTVVYSAATVAVALATLAVFPMGFLRSMGIAGAAVAVVAALASLVVAPVFFGLWGAKLARRTKDRSRDDDRWYRLSHAVMRRPGVIATATALVMLVLAAPALRADWTPVDATIIPKDLSSRIVADTLTERYSGDSSTPVTVALRGTDVTSFADAAASLPGVAAPAEPVSLGANTWQLDLLVKGDAAGDEARRVVEEVRALAADRGVDALVAGPAAEFIDQQDAIGSTLPLAVTLLVVLTMLVLWLMTGSVVLPVKAVVMNVLTVGVSLGAITFVYQDGRLTGLLGYTPNGGVEPTNFLVAAAMVFALSTDYGVFLLGRIKEARESGLGEREAVATGLGRTGSIVTAAALLLAVAIGAFSTSEISFMQQIGIATAVGVLVDAFIVRSLLVPTLMAMMGKWNWWSPMWLRRVHDRVGLSEGRPELVTAS